MCQIWTNWTLNRDCRNEAKCPNCSGSHSAFSRDCPKWIQEKQVQIIKAEKGIFPEARRLASSGYNTSSVSQTHSVAAVVKQGIPTSRPSVCSVHTQTELTWPNSQESPTTIPSISVSLQASQTSDVEQPVPSTSSAKSPNCGSNSQSKGKGKNKIPTIKRPRFADNPVTMYIVQQIRCAGCRRFDGVENRHRYYLMETLQWNIRGLQANREELNVLLSNFNPTIACLQETFLNADKTVKIKTTLLKK